MLPVAEVYQSFQDQGRYAGKPAVIVRFQGCAVGCPWCDIRGSWHLRRRVEAAGLGEGSEDGGAYAMFSDCDLAEAILDDAFPASHVVLTGGEPAVHDLVALTTTLLRAGQTVQIETSGTEPLRVARGVWKTVAPKEDMPGRRTLDPGALMAADELMFVVGKPENIRQAARLRKMANAKAEVWLQPLSQSAAATDLCLAGAIEHGWNVAIATRKILGLR